MIENAYAAGLIPGPDFSMNMVFILFMFAVLYFMVLRPQLKRQKEHRAMLETLSKGDEVIVAGIVGKVVEIGADMVKVEVAKGVTLQVQRSAIGNLLPKGTLQ